MSLGTVDPRNQILSSRVSISHCGILHLEGSSIDAGLISQMLCGAVQKPTVGVTWLWFVQYGKCSTGPMMALALSTVAFTGKRLKSVLAVETASAPHSAELGLSCHLFGHCWW